MSLRDLESSIRVLNGVFDIMIGVLYQVFMATL